MSSRRSDPLAQVSDFDIRLLRLFRSVVECGGFSAAESVLGIGRSAISQQMSDLEQRLGLRLCQRGRAGFALTEEGREVYQSSLQLFGALESFRNGVNGLHRELRGELHIGLTDNLVTVPHMRITHALARLKELGPDVRIQIVKPEQQSRHVATRDQHQQRDASEQEQQARARAGGEMAAERRDAYVERRAVVGDQADPRADRGQLVVRGGQ